MSKLNELKQELLKQFKKMNKAARERFAVNQGFTNADAYLKFLGTEEPVKAVTPKKKPAKVVETKAEEPAQDKVIAFDTTGSMAAYLNDVRKHITKLIPELFADNPNLRIKVVAFGDYCDMPSKNHFGAAYQESELTNDQEKLIKFVNQAKATNGGDVDEFYELVIKKVVEETAWRKEAKKSVLMIADYNPHEVGYNYFDRVANNQIDWKVEAKKAADLGIQFDTLQILPSIGWYKELSAITGGVNMPFQSSDKTADLLKVSTYARGGEKYKKKFEETRSFFAASGDTEMVASMDALTKVMD